MLSTIYVFVHHRMVEQVSVHEVLKNSGPWFKVPPDVCRLIHVRVALRWSLKLEELNVDKRLWTFNEKLIPNVDKQLKKAGLLTSEGQIWQMGRKNTRDRRVEQVLTHNGCSTLKNSLSKCGEVIWSSLPFFYFFSDDRHALSECHNVGAYPFYVTYSMCQIMPSINKEEKPVGALANLNQFLAGLVPFLREPDYQTEFLNILYLWLTRRV